MRTVIENREDLVTNYTKNEREYHYPDNKLGDSKSCFYNFGETQDAQFVFSSNEIKCQYVQSFVNEFLNTD